jgi:ABC-type nitrate/sulfonate/bicarbonate transport system substrate-binding protein
LIGKSILVNRLGSIRHRAALVALEQLGLTADQVDFVVMRDTDDPTLAAAIEGGSVSAAVMAPPLLQVYKDAGLHPLIDMTGLDVGFVRVGIGTLRSYVAEHRDIALGTLKALIEAAHLMKTDREGTLAILAEYTSLDPVANAADLEAMYDIFVTHNLQTDLYPSEEALLVSLELEALDNPDAAKLTPADYTDLSLLDEIHASGFMETLP